MKRFWSKVDKTSAVVLPNVDTPCWNWIAGSRNGRYGAFKLDGKVVDSHRVAFELQNGTIPNGQCVLHKCDNMRCVKGDHLFLGSLKDNFDDMWSKNRFVANGAKGRKSGMAGTAWCYICKTFMSDTFFHKNASRWNGLNARCKPCAIKSMDDYRKRNVI
jgi:hypothetical protein